MLRQSSTLMPSSSRTTTVASCSSPARWRMKKYRSGTSASTSMKSPSRLLGLNAWNTPQVVANGGRYVQDNAFVDAFWSEDEDEAVQQFITTFESTVERAPRHRCTDLGRHPLLTAAVLEGGDSRESIQEGCQVIEIDDPVAGVRPSMKTMKSPGRSTS